MLRKYTCHVVEHGLKCREAYFVSWISALNPRGEKQTSVLLCTSLYFFVLPCTSSYFFVLHIRLWEYAKSFSLKNRTKMFHYWEQHFWYLPITEGLFCLWEKMKMKKSIWSVLHGTSSVLLGTSPYFSVLPCTSLYFPVLLCTSLYFLELVYFRSTEVLLFPLV